MFTVFDALPARPEFVSFWAAIIKEAGRSPLTIFALILLILASLAWYFFRKDVTWVRLVIFLLGYGGAVGVGYVALHPIFVPPPDGLPKIAFGQLRNSIGSGTEPIDLTIWNTAPSIRKVFWLESNGTKNPFATLRPGEQQN